MQLPIRAMAANDAAIEIAKELTFLAREYGARQEVPAETMAECIKMVRLKFSSIGVKEIREAYRAWASGEIVAQEMWGGTFNVSQMSSVLRAYIEYRRQIAAKIQKNLDEQLAAEAEASFDKESATEAARVYFLDNQVAQIRQIAKGWWDVPWMYFELSRALGLIQLTKEEYQDIYASAQEAVPHERKRLMAEIGAGISAGGMRTTKSILAERVYDMTDEDMAKEIARKMAFFTIFCTD